MRKLVMAVIKSGGGAFLALLSGAVAMKIMALMAGPSGIGLFSLLRQTQQTASVIGACGGQTSIVQGMASKCGQERDEYMVTAFWFFVLGTIVTVASILIVAPELGPMVFGKYAQAVGLFRWLAVPAGLGIAVFFFNGVLNSHQAIGRLACVQIVTAAVAALFAYPASKQFNAGSGLMFVLLLSISQLAGLLISVLTAYRSGWLMPLISLLPRSFYPEHCAHFAKIAGTTLATALLNAAGVLLIRTLVTNRQGLHGAGVFDVAWTLSMMYVMLVLASFGSYYLPALASIKNGFERSQLVQQVFQLAYLLAIPLVTAIAIGRPIVVHLLYTSSFDSALDIMRWMVIGDYFRISGWVLAMPVVAYADMKTFFWTEFAGNGGILLFAVLSLMIFNDSQGIGFGFMVVNAIYFAFMLKYVKTKYAITLDEKMLRGWGAGLLLIIIACVITWRDREMHLLPALLIMSVALFLTWHGLGQGMRRELIKNLNKRMALR